jgi:hypothetical protein
MTNEMLLKDAKNENSGINVINKHGYTVLSELMVTS